MTRHLNQATEFVRRRHRHSRSTAGVRITVGAQLDGELVDEAIAGRPVCGRHNDGRTLKILRVCTGGTPNACSFLYARVARVARLLGYTRILTYSLEAES